MLEGAGRGITVERRGMDQSKTMHECPTDMDSGVGTDCGSWGWAG